MSNYTISEQHKEELFAALSKAQAVMAGATKDATNPHFGNKYADLAAVWEACRTPLAENGLSVLQPTSADGAKVTVTTILAHVSGGWIASELTMTSDKVTPQGVGSCITYGRRYGLSAMVGISPEDDDGNLASGGSREKQAEVVARKTGKKPEPETKHEPTQATNFKFLAACAEIKGIIGETLYYGCLKSHGYAKSTLITARQDEVTVYRSLGEVKKAVEAVALGILSPTMSAEVFHAIPDKKVSAGFLALKERIAKATGSVDTAGEEYERHRAESSSQFDFFGRLLHAADYYESQHVA